MHGLYLLWWVQERQMSPAVVAAVLAAGDLALMGLELPTGRFADRFGHRASLIAGSLIQTAGMLWCWLGRDVPDLIVASALVALGDAFRSGADEALLYRTCVALGREDAFQRIVARAASAELAALVGLILAGGLIVQAWGFAAGWLAEVTLCAAGLAVACTMTEPPSATRLGENRTGHDPAGLTSRALAILILPGSFLGAAAGGAAFLAQTSGITDPNAMTMLVAALTLVEAAGSAAASRLPPAGARSQAVLAGAGAVLLCLGLTSPRIFLITVFGLSFLVGVAEPLRAAAIQRLAADDARAQAASLASACDMAFSTIGLPAAGWWQHRRRRRR
jgi:MFS family permease